MLRRLCPFLLLLVGCQAPPIDLAGEWADGNVRLSLAKDKTFSLEEEGHTLAGTYAKVGDTVYVQPESYDGQSLDAVNLKAMDEAIKLGKQTDLVSVSYRFEPREFTIDGGDILRMKPVPPPNGVDPLPLRVFKRSSGPPVD
jgi:hypothetical protein